MPDLTRNLIVMAFASIWLLHGQVADAELHIMMTNNEEVELSEQEKRDLATVAASLIPNPSETLLKSINTANGFALLDDQRADPDAQHTLWMTIMYPEVDLNEHRKQEPKIDCEGSYKPLILDNCRESSGWSVRVAGYDYVRVNRESTTREKAAEMYSSLDSAALESATGSAITSSGIHHILFNSRSGLYHLIGNTASGEQFFIYLRPIEDINATEYEITEWSCQ